MTLGWFREQSEKEKERLTVYIRKNMQEYNVCYELLSLAWSSTAEINLMSLQALLELGKECKKNLPGTFGGSNLGWSSRPEQMSSIEQHWISQLTETNGRNR